MMQRDRELLLASSRAGRAGEAGQAGQNRAERAEHGRQGRRACQSMCKRTKRRICHSLVCHKTCFGDSKLWDSETIVFFCVVVPKAFETNVFVQPKSSLTLEIQDSSSEILGLAKSIMFVLSESP